MGEQLVTSGGSSLCNSCLYIKREIRKGNYVADFTRTTTQCMSLHDQGFPNRGGGEFPLGEVRWEIFLGGFTLYGGENLRRSDFDHSNLIQGQKQHSVNMQY